MAGTLDGAAAVREKQLSRVPSERKVAEVQGKLQKGGCEEERLRDQRSHADCHLGREPGLIESKPSLGPESDSQGHNNAFEIATKSARSLAYENASVLENHHCACCFRLLLKCKVMTNFSKEARKECMINARIAILSTDMMMHGKLQSLLQDGFNKGLHGDDERQECMRSLLIATLVHAADLCGQGFATEQAVLWEERVIREFREQAVKERENNVPVSQFMANLNTTKAIASMQANFVDNVVQPYIKSFVAFAPSLQEFWLGNLQTNRERNAKLANASA
ncbi:hypothetical protein CYMTET_48961 [Cymbomonas tetramitiformis]|uniref:PDEase domain-containing protein n=1 Tax=Cymbomonas tetramitiformis TaxID=36881 RepID=A0AAE0BSF2_9CHLO|nr:hypothetical protein CYMTET_48961 [Cymbomonas tetramitiformis]